jgi:glucose-6-phosphate dehydrogenase assembly protein OpcA
MAGALSADRVLKELDELWVSLAHAPGSAEATNVLRACAMTLIVLEEASADPAASTATVADLMRDHPNRAVIVRVRAGADALLDHRVTAQCRMPFGGGRQVCCEQIEIDISEASLPGLAPILLAIAAPDLPLVVWCRSARLFGLGALDTLFARAGKFMVDSCPLVGLASRFGDGLHIADLEWTAVTRWREVVAQVFEDPTLRDLASRIQRVRLLYAAAAPPAAAYYVAAWIMVCSDCRELDVRFEEAPAIDGITGIEGVVLEGESHTMSIRRAQGDAVLIEVDSLRSCTVIPVWSEAELLGKELGIFEHDAMFARVLPVAARLAAK